MAYIYGGNGYRAGAAGVESDLGLRDYYAQQAAQALGQGQGYATDEQIAQARGDLGGAMAGYQDLMNNGMYSQGDMDSMVSAKTQQIMGTTRAMQQNFNTQQAARGLGGNAGATMAGGLAGQFAAAGQRGQATADVLGANAQSKMAGLQGYGQLSGQMANLAAMPTRMDLDMGQYADEYEKWRNAQVGYDGAQWGAPPTQPDYYAGGTGASTGGGTGSSPNGTLSGGITKKKNNYVY